MEMKPTLQICIGNWTQNGAQVELIMMKMKRTSVVFTNSLSLSQKRSPPKGATSKHFKISFY